MPKGKSDTNWEHGLAGQLVGKFRLLEFIGAGRIGHVYRAEITDLPQSERAVKLTFDKLKVGWEVELQKVLALELVDGVVHYHEHGAQLITHNKTSRLCQYTGWDYIAPGENLKQHLRRKKSIETSFLFAVVESILRVLHACKERGVPRHGDLHSGNILIGDETHAKLDDSLKPRAPIYISDFGYGATGGVQVPKDDYDGLSKIINEMIPHVEDAKATATHKKMLRALKGDLGKLLCEANENERRSPFEILRVLRDIKMSAQAGEPKAPGPGSSTGTPEQLVDGPSVGQFQVSEMIGERWEWWQRLLLSAVLT